jgi:hypothetical protein
MEPVLAGDLAQWSESRLPWLRYQPGLARSCGTVDVQYVSFNRFRPAGGLDELPSTLSSWGNLYEYGEIGMNFTNGREYGC